MSIKIKSYFERTSDRLERTTDFFKGTCIYSVVFDLKCKKKIFLQNLVTYLLQFLVNWFLNNKYYRRTKILRTFRAKIDRLFLNNQLSKLCIYYMVAEECQ